MASDDETKDKVGMLDKREEFPGWKGRMLLLAMEKGDTDGIFTDTGGNPTLGYQSYPVGQPGNAKRKAWLELSKKLTGKVGGKITNSALRRIWTEELARVMRTGAQPGALNEVPFVFAKCMAVLETECARRSESATQIARGDFILALQSFLDKSPRGTNESSSSKGTAHGFSAYVDEIRKAEEKLRTYGVQMTDAEKKQLFFAHFNATSDSWPTLVTYWKQDGTLNFDDILSRGITEQQALDAKANVDQVAGVRAFNAMNGGKGDRDGDGRKHKKPRGGRGAADAAAEGYYFDRRNAKGKGAKGKGAKGGGKSGAKGGKGKNGKGGRGRGAGGRGGWRGRGWSDDAQLECWNCGGRGHRSSECPSAKQGEKRQISIPGMIGIGTQPEASDTLFEGICEYGVILMLTVMFATIAWHLEGGNSPPHFPPDGGSCVGGTNCQVCTTTCQEPLFTTQDQGEIRGLGHGRRRQQSNT